MRFSLAVAFVALASPAFADPIAQDINSGKGLSDTAAMSISARHRVRIDANGNDTQGVYDALVAKHAAANGVPESLVRRVIMRESRYNPRAISKGNFGIMQIRLGTARALGYSGGAQGLLDADTNMTYAVKYLAGAYKVAGGNHDRAVGLYARGYYYDAKRKGMNAYALADATPFAPVFESRAEAVAERPAGGNVEQGRGTEVLEDRLAAH